MRSDQIIVIVIVASLLASCARSAVMPMAADTVKISTSAAPVCGSTGAQDVAVRRAAIETINRGFDKFIVLGSGAANNVRVIGYTGGAATTSGTATATRVGNYVEITGQSQTTYSPGLPIMGGRHEQGVVIRMFRDGDPAGANGVPARDILGPEWPSLIKQSAATIC